MVGRLHFVSVHLQQHAVSENVTFIPGLICVCCAMSVFFFPLPHPPSGPRPVPSSLCNRKWTPSHHRIRKHLALHDNTGVSEEHGPGWWTSISTFHTLRHNMSAWIYLGCFSHCFNFLCQNTANERFDRFRRHCYSLECQEKSTWHSGVTKGQRLWRKSVGFAMFCFFQCSCFIFVHLVKTSV